MHSNGAFYAIADECSHASIPLSEETTGDGEIECYLHGSRFDLRTGEPIGLPATEPIPIYLCIVEGDDVLIDVSAPIISGGTAPDPPRSFVNVSHTQGVLSCHVNSGYYLTFTFQSTPRQARRRSSRGST